MLYKHALILLFVGLILILSGMPTLADQNKRTNPDNKNMVQSFPQQPIIDLNARINNLANLIKALEAENTKLNKRLTELEYRFNNANFTGNPQGYCGIVLEPSDQHPGCYERMYVVCN